jgi:hypothetical protein
METLATVDASSSEAADWKTGRTGIKLRFIKVPLMFTMDSSMSQHISFAPTAYDEGKKHKVTLEITEEQAALFEKLEVGLREHADPSAVWASPLKHTAYGHQLTCKITDAIQYYDGASQPCADPVEWRGIQCNACLRIATIWAQRTTQGFSVELMALQYEAGAVPKLANPFGVSRLP